VIWLLIACSFPTVSLPAWDGKSMQGSI